MKKNVLLPLTLSALLACGGTSVFAADTTTETQNNTAVTEEAADTTTEATPDTDATTDETAATDEATETIPASEITPAEEATTDEATETTPAEEATPALSISYTLDADAAEGDVHCIPLRATADALGLTVAWNAETRTATLSSETRSMDFAEGVDSYVSTSKIEGAVGMTSPVTYGVAPFINEEGVMYVPAASFGVLVGFDVVITDTEITITEQVAADTTTEETTTEEAPADGTAAEETTTEEAPADGTTTEETTTEEAPATDAAKEEAPAADATVTE